MRRRFLAAVLTFSLCAAVPAQQQAAGHQREGDDANPPERVRQFAALPNWTGVWETELSAQLNSGELDKAMAEAVRHPERNTTVLAPKEVLHPAETLFFSRMQLIREPRTTRSGSAATSACRRKSVRLLPPRSMRAA